MDVFNDSTSNFLLTIFSTLFGYNEKDCIFAPSVPAQPLNNAQISGPFFLKFS